ncbi:MAG: DUF6351 family protein [Gemmatimonadota bacterium]
MAVPIYVRRVHALVVAGALSGCGSAAPDPAPLQADPAVGDTLAVAAAVASRSTTCADLIQVDFGPDVELTAAEVAPAAGPGTVRSNPYSPPFPVAFPAYCRVTGTINERVGAGGHTYGLGFELRMPVPAEWNGRFLFQGGGGLNGTINPPLGDVAAGGEPALARGFAVVATDGGHEGNVFDATFMNDQKASLDFAQDAVPTVARIAKSIVAEHYGRPVDHAYMTGCSTGGREGMLSVQRYPYLFDGVVVGAPAMRTGYSNLALLHAAVEFNEAAPLDGQGNPLPGQLYSDADRDLIIDGLLDQCDGLDGLEDGVIENVAACDFQPVRLRCQGEKTDACLGAEQVEALIEAFQPPVDAAGQPLYVPFPYDTGIAFRGSGIPGFLPDATSRGPMTPADATSADYDAEARRIRMDESQRLVDTHTWTTLNTFIQRGGKVIFYHGVSDPWFSAWDTLDYWKRARERNSPDTWDDASRFYFIPGMGHCGGGANTFDRFDLLSAVVDWVERGEAPEAVPSFRSQPTAAERPRCPWPTYPHYTGGDEAAASSFECRAGPAGR